MDISALSALGSSGVQASSLYALLSAFSASSGSDGDAGSSALQSDSLDISGAGWAASSGSGFNPLQQDMTRLGSLISSGDLTDAQTLLARIQQHLQAGPDGSASAGSDSSSTSSTSGTSGSSTLASDFTALATALSSGSTTSAQSVFQTLQSDLASLAPSGPPPARPVPVRHRLRRRQPPAAGHEQAGQPGRRRHLRLGQRPECLAPVRVPGLQFLGA